MFIYIYMYLHLPHPPLNPSTPQKQCYTHKRWQLLKPVLRAHLEATAANASSPSGGGGESGPTQLVRTGKNKYIYF